MQCCLGMTGMRGRSCVSAVEAIVRLLLAPMWFWHHRHVAAAVYVLQVLRIVINGYLQLLGPRIVHCGLGTKDKLLLLCSACAKPFVNASLQFRCTNTKGQAQPAAKRLKTDAIAAPPVSCKRKDHSSPNSGYMVVQPSSRERCNTTKACSAFHTRQCDACPKQGSYFVPCRLPTVHTQTSCQHASKLCAVPSQVQYMLKSAEGRHADVMYRENQHKPQL